MLNQHRGCSPGVPSVHMGINRCSRRLGSIAARMLCTTAYASRLWCSLAKHFTTGPPRGWFNAW